MGNKLQEPKVAIEGVSVKNADMTGATLVFNIAIENPNDVDIKVDNVSYTVYLNDQEISQGATDKKITVAKNGTGNVELPLPIEYRKVFNNIKELVFAESAAYKIKGKAKVNLFSIPFSKEGSVKLR